MEGLELLARTHDLVLASCRLDTQQGWEAVRAYLDAHGLSWLDMEKGKPLADVYLDDRAVCFGGDWGQAIEQIKRFAPWNAFRKAVTCSRGRVTSAFPGVRKN